MGNVGVMTDRIFSRNGAAQLQQARADLRAIDNPAEPGRLFVLQNADELVEPLLIEALRRDPHLRFGMIAMQVVRLPRQ